MIEPMEYEWRHYDSDLLPEDLYGGAPTKERRQVWRDLWDREQFFFFIAVNLRQRWCTHWLR